MNFWWTLNIIESYSTDIKINVGVDKYAIIHTKTQEFLEGSYWAH